MCAGSMPFSLPCHFEAPDLKVGLPLYQNGKIIGYSAVDTVDGWRPLVENGKHVMCWYRTDLLPPPVSDLQEHARHQSSAQAATTSDAVDSRST